MIDKKFSKYGMSNVIEAAFSLFTPEFFSR